MLITNVKICRQKTLYKFCVIYKNMTFFVKCMFIPESSLEQQVESDNGIFRVHHRHCKSKCCLGQHVACQVRIR